jgi:hypothetical protein
MPTTEYTDTPLGTIDLTPEERFTVVGIGHPVTAITVYPGSFRLVAGARERATRLTNTFVLAPALAARVQRVWANWTVVAPTPPAPPLTYFVDEDSDLDPTIWSHLDDPENPEDPKAVLRLSELPASARPHWARITRAFTEGR